MTTTKTKDPMNTGGVYPHPSPEMLQACADALAFEALAETVRPDIQAIESKLLRRFEFVEQRTGKRITDANRLYLADDSDDMTDYYRQRHEAIITAGYKVKQDYCPLLIAESRKLDAEKQLMKAQWELLEKHGHITDAAGMYDGTLSNTERFNQAVDLGKRFTASFIPESMIEASKRKAFRTVRGAK